MSDDKEKLTVLEKRAAAQKWREEKADQYRKALRSSVLGLEIMIFILMGGGIGYYIDKHYETTPWAFWIGSFIGISGAIKTMVVMIREYNQAYGDSEENESQSESSHESDF
jgi:F0F1-type ATP synthase assembly protein I